ncbi:MAG: hypothetical protein ACRDHZ_23535, partial [Ktedonobacteraceae bacterium]
MGIDTHELPLSANEDDTYVRDFIENAEHFEPAVYGIPPTIGYGYALLLKGSNGIYALTNALQDQLTADFNGIGIDISPDFSTLSEIAQDLNDPTAQNISNENSEEQSLGLN